MFKSFVLFWLDRNYTNNLRLNMFLLLTQIGLITYFFTRLPPQVPVYYSLIWGEDRLGATGTLFLLPGFCLFVFTLNTILAAVMAGNQKVLSKILLQSSAVISILALVALLNILRITL